MNPGLAKLEKYPFERLAALKAGIEPPAELVHINMSIGEPKHEAPAFVLETLKNSLDGLSNYPLTAGSLELRQSIADWLNWRFKCGDTIKADKNVLPVNGTREALFAIAQCFCGGASTAQNQDQNKNQSGKYVVMPNPFYQIYEGAAYLGGDQPYYVDIDENTGLAAYDQVPESIWQNTSILYISSPGNPTGAVVGMESLQALIEKARKYNFVLCSDECYSELYFDENKPPCGILQAAFEMGGSDGTSKDNSKTDVFKNCLAFHSLSKRSSLPGMRSGFVAGDAALIETFRLYRTYHGSAMSPPYQAASTVAWQDEEHVRANRALYREKFAATHAILSQAMEVKIPAGAFYYWLRTPCHDTDFARDLFKYKNVTVLPGSYLSRQTANNSGKNPDSKKNNYVRVALVPPLADCLEAAERIKDFVKAHYK